MRDNFNRAVVLVGLTMLLFGCAASVTTDIKGDRTIVQGTVGSLHDGSGDRRMFFVLHDADTGVDYLAVIDAGIIELKPKPLSSYPVVEQTTQKDH